MFAAGLQSAIVFIGTVFGAIGSAIGFVIVLIVALPLLCFGLAVHNYSVKTTAPMIRGIYGGDD